MGHARTICHKNWSLFPYIIPNEQPGQGCHASFYILLEQALKQVHKTCCTASSWLLHILLLGETFRFSILAFTMFVQKGSY